MRFFSLLLNALVGVAVFLKLTGRIDLDWFYIWLPHLILVGALIGVGIASGFIKLRIWQLEGQLKKDVTPEQLALIKIKLRYRGK